MAKKMCSCHPVIMSQGAINILYDWFPDSNGNLNVDEVWQCIMHHYSEDGMTYCTDTDEAEELANKVETLVVEGRLYMFSPVLA